MMINFDANLSLEQLEDDYWGEPTYSSGLVIGCHKYRKVPVNQLGSEGLRLLIGQKIGLEYLVPIAISMLAENPWIRGDYYHGDLLQNVLRIDSSFWNKHQDWYYDLDSIMISVECFEKLNLLVSWEQTKNELFGESN